MELDLTDGDESFSDRNKAAICYGMSSEDEDPVDDVFEAPRDDEYSSGVGCLRDYSHDLRVRKEIDWDALTREGNYRNYYVTPSASSPAYSNEEPAVDQLLEEVLHKVPSADISCPVRVTQSLLT